MAPQIRAQGLLFRIFDDAAWKGSAYNMGKTKRILLWVVKNIEEIMGCVCLGGMAAVTTYNVIARYVFNGTKGWAEEMAVMLLIWSTFMGAAACYKRNQHATMDFLIARLPKKAQYWLRLFITAILVVLFAYLTIIAWEFTASISKRTTFFRLSYKFLDFAAVLSFFSMFVYSCIFLYEAIAKPKKFSERHDSRYGTVDDDTEDNARSEGEESMV